MFIKQIFFLNNHTKYLNWLFLKMDTQEQLWWLWIICLREAFTDLTTCCNIKLNVFFLFFSVIVLLSRAAQWIRSPGWAHLKIRCERRARRWDVGHVRTREVLAYFQWLSLIPSLFIYQARFKPGPSRFSDRPVCAENVIYETFVVMRKLRSISLHCFHGEKQKWRYVHSTSLQVSLHNPFAPWMQWSEASPNFPPQNKGFINYVFCRNCAVRNPAGTRLDSSLVTK